MKLSRCLFATLLVFIFSASIHAQLFEDFEAGDKTAYAGASVSLASGDWFLEDALLGSLANDKYNGDQGVRMDRREGKMGNIYMEFDKTNGADEVSFYLAHYGNNANSAALQVQYSTDGGSTWENVGDEITAPFELTQFSVPVQVDGNIRFKFIQSSGTDRMNIDDIRITNYVQPQEEATINVFVNEETVQHQDEVTFETTLTGNESSKTIEIRNSGSADLEIEEITVSSPFSISALQDSSLGLNESTELTLTFAPEAEGEYLSPDDFEIISNASNHPSFTLTVQGDAVDGGGIIPISTARELSQGEIITVTGWVTVAGEFEGPVYFQDETGGIAWFNFDLMRDEQDGFTLDVQRGDSIVITGELGEFNDLIQIVGDDVEYEFFPEANREVVPLPITVSALNAGNYEGQLVSMEVEVQHDGAFQSDEYEITDETGTGVLYINDDTEIVGATAPEGTTTIVGVVGIFAGTYQILPRDLEDIDAEVFEIPGEDISKDFTLDIVTWNIEWFGSSSNGPEDDDVQLQNVIQVIDSIDADIFALQEISDPGKFAELDAALEEYRGFEAGYSQTQKTAILFKTSVVDSLDSDLITNGMTQQNWANGRYPLFFNFSVSFDGEEREFYLYNIHAKATTENPSGDYNQRLNASAELKSYLDTFRDEENVIVIGDYNDELTLSTYNDNDSPYKNFLDDAEYTVLTQSLENRGFTSYSSYSMIDHIMISSELEDEYFEGTERVENPSYIGSYLSETSDHYPVWVRFMWTGETSTTEPVDAASEITLKQNYPNPFNPSTVIAYTLDQAANVTLEVFDMTGRKVATLVNSRQTAGDKEVSFDASALSSGVYIYRLSAGSRQLTKKMILVK